MTARLAMLRAVIANPAKNPTATALVIGIVVVMFLLVGTSLLAWALPRGGASTGSHCTRTRSVGAASKARWLWSVIAAIIALAALAWGWTMTSDSAFCGRVCHAMASPYATWGASVHSATPCIRCHEGRPVLSAPAAMLTRGSSLVAQITGRSEGGRFSIPASRCLDCHSSIATRVVVSDRGVIMSHKQVIAAGAACDDCHGSQGHEKVGRATAMATCLRCHDGTKASAACVTCHRKDLGSLKGAENERFGKTQ